MKRWKKVLLGVVGVLTAAVVTIGVLERRTYQAPYPAITASNDPAVIERGRYLVYGPAHCIECHGDHDKKHLSGGHEWNLPLGKIYAKNITPDKETGIGKLTDAEIARTLRYGVGHDGRAMLPFMPFANMSDEDLTAVVSYLRAQEPVHHAVPSHEPNLLGRAVIALVIRPRGPDGTPPATSPKGPTIERGKYLANNVANCVTCHSKLNDVGAIVGPKFAGGGKHGTFVSPNLTPDRETGRIAAWSEELFVARFKAGAGPKDSPMPWATFATITEDDARALYRYLQSLPPVHNVVDAPKKEVVAGK